MVNYIYKSGNKALIAIIYLSLILTVSPLKAQINLKKGVPESSIFDLDFAKTSEKLLKKKGKKAWTSDLLYLYTYNLFLKTYLEASNSDFANFEEYSNRLIDLLKKKEGEKYWGMLSKIYLQKAYIHFIKDEKLKCVYALMNGNKALSRLTETYADYKKVAAIYYIVGSTVPDKYSKFAQFMGFKGDMIKGLSDIKAYNATAKSIQSELDFLNKEEGLVVELFIKNLLGIELIYKEIDTDRTLLYQYVYFSSSRFGAKDKVKAIALLQEKYPFCPLRFLFLKAKYEIELNAPKGLSDMLHFLKENKKLPFSHIAYDYIARYHQINGNKSDLEQNAKEWEVLESPSFPIDQSAKAHNTSKNRFLLHARLLFDAGAWLQADSVLESSDCKASCIDLSDKLEWQYRKARIKEVTAHTPIAISAYQSIVNSQLSEYYFVPYSAYRLAKIAFAQGAFEQVKQRIEECRKLNKGQYRYAIEQKCKYLLLKMASGKENS